MFCQSCGAEHKENDRFCGKCGQPINGYKIGSPHSSSVETYENVIGNLKKISRRHNGIIHILKTYISRPISILKEFKDEDTVKASIGIGIMMLIIYGLLSIIYTNELISGFIKILKGFPQTLSSLGFISDVEASNEPAIHNILGVTTQIKAFINSADIFKYSTLFLLTLLVITFIMLMLMNAFVLKMELNYKDILFLTVVSYMPVVTIFILQLAIGLINTSFSIILTPIGFVFSIITLYKGLCEYSTVNEDKIFMFLAVEIIIAVLVMVLLVDRITINYIRSIML